MNLRNTALVLVLVVTTGCGGAGVSVGPPVAGPTTVDHTIDGGQRPTQPIEFSAEGQPWSEAIAFIGVAAREGSIRSMNSLPAWALVDAHEVVALQPGANGIWAATRGGLLSVTSDAVSERIMREDGLRSHAIQTVSATNNDELLVTFTEGGCQFYGNGLLTDCPDALDEYRITDLVTFGTAPVVATWGGDVLRLDGEGRIDGVLANHALTTAAEVCAGSLWLGSHGSGLGRLDEGGAWSVSPEHRVVEALSCVDDVLYSAGPAGLFRHTVGEPQLVDLSARRTHVRYLAQSVGGLIVGFTGGEARLVPWDELAGNNRVRGISLDLPLLADRALAAQGRVWFSGPTGLISVDEVGLDGLETINLPGPGSTDIAALAAQDDRLAAGLFRGGLAIWDGADWLNITASDSLASNDVNSLSFDRDGRLWVGTSAGLSIVASDGAIVARADATAMPCAHINALLNVEALALGAHTVVATSCGVGFLDDEGRVVSWEGREEGLPHRIVYDLTVWNGQLLAGTNDGLAFRAPTGQWTSYRAGQMNVQDNWITALATFSSGELAVGTYSGGVYVGASLEELERVDGPRYINLTALQPMQDGMLVGGLSEGAYVLAADGSSRALSVDCLAGDDVTAFATWRGELAVATRAGARLCSLR